ncbi:DUF547 domain-containing protein [Vampirovibrio chlorellavorus]|uniref:DUF547 domain-containing protein n=1 Tax=Vampirovibrio chlorellavorus TaxID=758823 RepID=UPI0026E9F926|nr:DUF547 domain-containing protein [Vampirovibrio chlorellavorus]
MRLFRLTTAYMLGTVALLALLGLSGGAQAGRVLNDSLVTHPFRHHVWQDVLNFAVTEKGEVDFGKVKAYPRRLNEYLAQLAAVSPESEPKDFPQDNDKIAYWINAHNALALRLIINEYPIRSVADVRNLETEARYLLGGKPYSLRQIRDRLGLWIKLDPQLMFALTEYTRGSPAIQKQAYEGLNLKMLESRAVAQALADAQVVQVVQGRPCGALRLSSFFQGFEAALFSRSVAEIEDGDALGEPGFVPVTFTGWAHYIQPMVPPAVAPRLGPDCGAGVRFLPADPALRQVRF